MNLKRLKWLIIPAVLVLMAKTGKAQDYFYLWLKDGTKMEFAIGGIEKLTFDGISDMEEYGHIMMQLMELKVYPNPVKDYAIIDYCLKNGGEVLIEVFALNGQRFMNIHRGFQQAGSYEYQWLTRDVPDGMYVCVIKQNQSLVSEKIIIKK